jgi:hypothetical protein
MVYTPGEVGFTLSKKSPVPFIVDCYFVWSLSFDLFGMGAPTRSLNSGQHSSPGHSRTRIPPHHDNVAVLEEARALLEDFNQFIKQLNCTQEHPYNTKSKFLIVGDINQIISCKMLKEIIISFLKGKAIPVQVWTGPEGFRRLRLPDFKTAHANGKVVSPTHQLSLSHRKYSWYSFLLEDELSPQT